MGRNPKNARRRFDTRLSFKELCRQLRITPGQRIIITRYLKEKFEGGENYDKC